MTDLAAPDSAQRGCLDENEVVEHCRGLGPAAARAAVEVHLDHCTACRELVSEFVRAFSSSDRTAVDSAATFVGAAAQSVEPTTDLLAPLSQLGRYLVLQLVGVGGMGVVYAGYDPKLDRKVALKLLAPRVALTSETQRRLMQEAQAMARVTHPHVVTIHDIGVDDDRVWLAMEFIDGVTLSTWLRARRRPWRELLVVLLAAGEGLAAVHAAGLVHRDFKPDNVMLAADGRARVMDFGLSRVDASGPKDRSTSALARAGEETRTSGLTRTGALLGTPRYMAPEQWLGEVADARSDVFSFCVVLWEALFGEHPFAGETQGDLIRAVCAGAKRAPPAGAGVPAWLRRVVEQGLEREPARRSPSMRALLDALRRDPTRRTRRRVVLASLALAAVGTAFGLEIDHQRRAAACTADAAGLAGVWTPALREELRRKARSTADAGVIETIERAIERGDAYSASWSAQRGRSCRSAAIDGTLDPVTHARVAACLDDDRAGLEVLAGEVPRADPGMLQRLGAALGGLRSPDRCADPNVLGRYPPTGGAVTAEAAAARRSVARIAMLVFIGALDDADAELRAVQSRVATLGLPRLQALVDMAAADLAYHRTDLATTRARLVTAHDSAGAAGVDEIAAEAATFLGEVVGQDDPTSGRAWLQLAEMWYARLGVGPDDSRRASLLHAHGRLAQATGDLDGAVAMFQRALGAARRFYGPSHPDVGALLLDLGGVRYGQGELIGAYTFTQQALAVTEAALGELHPRVGDALYNLAALREAAGDLTRADAHFRRALAIYARAYGPEDAAVGDVWRRIGAVELARGEHVEARAAFERALSVAERDPAGQREVRALALAGLGEADLALHGPARALPSLERALALPEFQVLDAGARASAQFALARALAAVDPLDRRADEHARGARTSLAGALPVPRVRIAAIEHWLAVRRRPAPGRGASRRSFP